MNARTRRRFVKKEPNLGFQIAPMIDVVFVILLFFMVAVGSAKVENAHNTQLPGGCGPIQLPDEVTIEITAGGDVFLNDAAVGEAGMKDLHQLAADVMVMKQASDAAGAHLLVTIQSAELAKYERVVDVLDALAKAKVKDVTFIAEDP